MKPGLGIEEPGEEIETPDLRNNTERYRQYLRQREFHCLRPHDLHLLGLLGVSTAVKCNRCARDARE
jgi:hypothetical protein